MSRNYFLNPRHIKMNIKRNVYDLKAAAIKVKFGYSLKKATDYYDLHYSTLQSYNKANRKKKKNRRSNRT